MTLSNCLSAALLEGRSILLTVLLTVTFLHSDCYDVMRNITILDLTRSKRCALKEKGYECAQYIRDVKYEIKLLHEQN